MKKTIIPILILIITMIAGLIFFQHRTITIKENQSKEISGIDDPIYNIYCSGEIKVNPVKINYSQDEFKTLSIAELRTKLTHHDYPEAQVPQALYYMGLKSLQDNKNDVGLAFHNCAASKYYNILSMERLAEVYMAANPPDFKKAYSYIISILLIDSVEKNDFASSVSQFGGKVMSMLDVLQRAKKVSDDDMEKIGREQQIFVGKKYPEVLKI